MVSESSKVILRRAGEDVRRVAALEGLEDDPGYQLAYRLLAGLHDGDILPAIESIYPAIRFMVEGKTPEGLAE